MKYPLQQTKVKPHINEAEYHDLYGQSISNPEKFWAEQAEKFITTTKKWSKIKNTSFASDNVSIKWFEGAKLNVSYNCIDKHLLKRANQTAIIWEGDEPSDTKEITYFELHKHVCRFANILKEMGVKKGDVVTIYLPMILEAAYAMLACARIGAIHSVVFGGFSPEALRGRIEDCNSKLIITSDEGVRGGKKIALKKNVDEAIKGLDAKVLVVKHTSGKVEWNKEKDIWYHEAIKNVSDNCEPVEMDAEDPLFVLYTSGSTGKPKGLLHTQMGYLLYSAITHKYVFDYQEGDIYWCTADVGWVTGHSYILYGPLCNGATTLMFEGVPNYPDISRFWQVIDKHNVTQFYTAPTAIRMLMSHGNKPVETSSRKSLRVLGSVGEPINPEAWRWYYEVVGNSKCPIVDTWWQTETGGHLITPLPYAILQKAGSATLPFFGVKPAIVDDKNQELGLSHLSPRDRDGVRAENNSTSQSPHPNSLPEGEGIEYLPAEGNLCILDSWPGQARTIWGDHNRFVETYFKPFPNRYFSGDGAKRDEDGYYWITGRVDDVINVSGHRIGTAEVESALILHKAVSEAGVVGYNHDIKGHGIYCFVVLSKEFLESLGLEKSRGQEVKGSDTAETSRSLDFLTSLKEELKEICKKEIGAIAKPDLIQFSSGIPKTRSGKIMRRILRKIANNDYVNLGDTRTLLNPEVIDELIENRLVKGE